MARRSILVAVVAALAAAVPGSALAATAPASAPVLTSVPYAFPLTLHWTPGNDLLNTSQSVYRSDGTCTTPVQQGGPITTFPGNTTTDFTGRPVDGTYCYYIKVADPLTTADSPGVTVSVDTTAPTATVTVGGQAPGGVVNGTVAVTGTGSDAVAGVASSVLHAGAVGACAGGPVLGATWDTTSLANGAYDVCNVVTDNAGHVTTASTTVTVANPVPLGSPGATAAAAAAGGATQSTPTGASTADRLAPRAPRKLSVRLARARAGAKRVPLMLHWVKPTADDLDRIVVVLNLRRAPVGPADGRRVYRGLGSSASLELGVGQTGYLALFAYDHGGNVSPPARRVVSLAPLVPLRPLTGTVVTSAPRLTWTARKGTAYYNVQLFHNGKRVLIGWPSTASFTVPAGKLEPGTYVWFVWPAVRHAGSDPTFGDLIGRATFVVEG